MLSAFYSAVQRPALLPRQVCLSTLQLAVDEWGAFQARASQALPYLVSWAHCRAPDSVGLELSLRFAFLKASRRCRCCWAMDQEGQGYELLEVREILRRDQCSLSVMSNPLGLEQRTWNEHCSVKQGRVPGEGVLGSPVNPGGWASQRHPFLGAAYVPHQSRVPRGAMGLARVSVKPKCKGCLVD